LSAKHIVLVTTISAAARELRVVNILASIRNLIAEVAEVAVPQHPTPVLKVREEV
jgi:hypothetical protein